MSIVELRAHIDCSGCENKVRKAVLKLDGVKNVDIDIRMQKITVTGWSNEEKILKAIRKKGIRVEPWTMPYNAQLHDFNNFYKQHMCFIHTPNPSTHYRRNGNVVHECTCYEPEPMVEKDVARLALFNDDNPTGCSIM